MPSTYAKHLLRALILIALAIDIRPASSSNLEAEASYIDHERAEQDYQIYPQIVDSSDEVPQPLPKTPSEKV